jgi:hypothetical protein
MRHRLFVLTILIILVGAWDAGCAGDNMGTIPTDESPVPGTLTAEPQPTTSIPTPSPDPPVGVVPREAQGVVALARADLAERLGVEREAIEVTAVEAAKWSDASLGCTQPGQMYAQVVTPGFRVVLKARRETYVYHTDREQTVMLCEEEPVMGTPTAPSPVGSGLDTLIQSARKDLAQRLSIKPDQIEVVEARSVVWPNAAMGCPQPGKTYAQVLTHGFVVVLEAKDRAYRYHADSGDRLILCEGETTSPLPTIPVTPGEILDGDPWMPVD